MNFGSILGCIWCCFGIVPFLYLSTLVLPTIAQFHASSMTGACPASGRTVTVFLIVIWLSNNFGPRISVLQKGETEHAAFRINDEKLTL